MNWPIFLYWMKINLLFICSTNMLVRQEPVMGSWARLLTVIWRTVLPLKNPKKCDPILVTLLKMRPHYSPSSRENATPATPSSGSFPLASYKEVPPLPGGGGDRSAVSRSKQISWVASKFLSEPLVFVFSTCCPLFSCYFDWCFY